MKQGVSVIICCYNSAKRLPETLRHLALQKVPSDIPWEVIVVNNASTDDTVHVAEQEWSQYNLSIPFRIVDQPKPGLSNARDKGFEVAEYEYCLFCDDDNWLQKDYVRIAFETMESDPMIGVVGGHGEPVVCERKLMVWKNLNKVGYGIGAQHQESGDITYVKGQVYGAGAVFNRSSYFKLKEYGFVSLLSDRTGTKLSSGGDTELCLALVLKGYKIYYSHKLRFKHFIPDERISTEYVHKMKLEKEHSRIPISLYRYKIFNPSLFHSKFIWWRELGYSFKRGLMSIGRDSDSYYFRYFIRLITDRKKFYHYRAYINRLYNDYTPDQAVNLEVTKLNLK